MDFPDTKDYSIWIEPDWNVKLKFMKMSLRLSFYLNRTRLECKVSTVDHRAFDNFNLNRTRLECKAFLTMPLSSAIIIWIEPDWNVKQISFSFEWYESTIWIEPDWNVKIAVDVSNCSFLIWIEPDWNVKEQNATSRKSCSVFE